MEKNLFGRAKRGYYAAFEKLHENLGLLVGPFLTKEEATEKYLLLILLPLSQKTIEPS